MAVGVMGIKLRGGRLVAAVQQVYVYLLLSFFNTMNWIYVLLISCVVCQKISDTDAFIVTPQSYTISQNIRYDHHTRGTQITTLQPLQLTNNNDEEYDTDPRDNFGRSLRGLQSSALKTQIDVGDTVVCKLSIPSEYTVYNIYICLFSVLHVSSISYVYSFHI